MNDRQEHLDRLMRGISEVDDDLLVDVMPAGVRGAEPSPRKDKGIAIRRAGAGAGRKTGRRKNWVPIAVAAACVVLAVGFMLVWNTAREKVDRGSPEDMRNCMNSGANEDFQDHILSSENQPTYFEPCEEKSFLNHILTQAKAEKAVWNRKMDDKSPASDGNVEKIARQITSLADRSALDILASSEGNAVYSPVSLYQVMAFLGNSLEDSQRASYEKIIGGFPDYQYEGRLAWFGLSEQETAGRYDPGNALILGKDLWNRSDQNRLASVGGAFMTDLYPSQADAKNSQETHGRDGGKADISFGSFRWLWDPAEELLFVTPFCLHTGWSRDLIKVSKSEGVFHAADGTPCDVMYRDADDASLRHYALPGAVACELPLLSGRLYLILPDEGLTPEDLLRQDHFFTALLSAEPAGEHAVARFPVLKFSSVHNLVGAQGFSELRSFVGKPLRFTWLKGSEISVPLIVQQIDFMLDGDVRGTDDQGPDAVGRMTLEAVFDRPFIFCLTDSENSVPLLAGVYRAPCR